MIQALVVSMFRIRAAAIGRLFACAAILAIGGYSRLASATVMESDSFQQGNGPFTPTYAPPAGDILLGLTPISAVGNFGQEGAGGVPVLTDGTFGTISGGNPANNSEFATAGANQSLTYSLAGPEELTSIVTLGGWNDLGRDTQEYSVSYSTGGPFIPLASVDYNPSASNGADAGVPTATQVVLDGFDIPGVTALEFDFADGPNGYQGYTEIAATAVPEPAGLVLFGVGAVAVCFAPKATLPSERRCISQLGQKLELE